MVSLIYDPSFLEHDTGEHPENFRRLLAIVNTLNQDPALGNVIKRVPPQLAPIEAIERCHDVSMIQNLQTWAEGGVRGIDADTTIGYRSFEVARLAAGAAMTAVDTVMSEEGGRSFALVRPPGHHATATQSMGFCLFNNAAIAARHAQIRYGAERILIVDWDVHHGNGTQDIFWNDPNVFYFSTHQFPYYPGTGSSGERGDGKGEGTTLNIPLRTGTSAAVHREAFTEALKQIEKRFPPDLIIVSAGFDSRRGDPLGGLMLEDSDFAEMTKDVLRIADKHGRGRLVSLLEGGYNLDLLGGSVASHMRALL